MLDELIMARTPAALAFSNAFAQSPLGQQNIPTEAENALRAGNRSPANGPSGSFRVWEPPARYSFRYFFLGGVAIFMSEGADSATFGFSFFGFLASRLLRT